MSGRRVAKPKRARRSRRSPGVGSAGALPQALPSNAILLADAPTPTSFSSRARDARFDEGPELEITGVEDLDAPTSSGCAVVLDSIPPPPSGLDARRPRWRFFGVVAAFAVIGLLVHERAEVARTWARIRFSMPELDVGASAAAAPPLGRANRAVRQGACPDDMALVQHDGTRVCVDRYEASCVEITESGDERPYSPYLSVEGHRVRAESRAGAVPQAYISRDEAEGACSEAGKRLCIEDEWRTACSGPSATQYPYGNVEDPQACNTHGVGPLGELFPNYGTALYDVRVMNDPSLDALPGTVAPSGTYAACTNAFGVFDMVGNLHEWTAESKGAFRGGYYLDTHDNGDGCAYVTTAHVPTYHDYSTGFRCCRDADAD